MQITVLKSSFSTSTNYIHFPLHLKKAPLLVEKLCHVDKALKANCTY